MSEAASSRSGTVSPAAANPNQTRAIVLRDLRTSLPTIDYSTVTVMVDSGFDLFTETIQLVERRPGSGQWRMPK